MRRETRFPDRRKCSLGQGRSFFPPLARNSRAGGKLRRRSHAPPRVRARICTRDRSRRHAGNTYFTLIITFHTPRNENGLPATKRKTLYKKKLRHATCISAHYASDNGKSSRMGREGARGGIPRRCAHYRISRLGRQRRILTVHLALNAAP